MYEDLVKSVMFSGFEPRLLEQIGAMVTPRHLESGKILFQQGQDFQCFYFVRSGLIKLSRLSEDGGEKVIEIIHKNNFFAEALMFMKSSHYPVQAMAIADCELYAIDASKYIRLLEGSTTVCLQLLGVMSQRIHQLVKDIDELTLHSTKNRLARFLLRCCGENNNSFCLELPKNTIASRLYMQPETLSRALNFFHQMGCIEVNKKTITILDKEALKAYLD